MFGQGPQLKGLLLVAMLANLHVVPRCHAFPGSNARRYGDNTEGHVVFQYVGQTVHQLEYGNLRLQVNITGGEVALRLLRTVMEKDLSKSGLQPGNKSWQRRQLQMMEVDRLLERCHALQDMKKQAHHEHLRSPRLIFTLITVFVLTAITAGAAYAIYKNSELNQMKDNENTLSASEASDLAATQGLQKSEQELHHLVRRGLAEVEDYYGNLQEAGWAQGALEVAKVMVQRYEDVLGSAMSHRLHPSACTGSTSPTWLRR